MFSHSELVMLVVAVSIKEDTMLLF